MLPGTPMQFLVTFLTPDLATAAAVALPAGLMRGIVEEEFVIGEISIAAPILDYSGRPAGAINIPVPSAR